MSTMMNTRVLILTDNIQISTKEMENCDVRKHIPKYLLNV